MKNILYLLLLFVVVGCDNSSDSGTITIDNEGLYVENFGESATTTFTTENVAEMSVSWQPTGWSTVISMSTGEITVTAPDDDGDDVDLLGYVVIKCETPGGTTFYDFIDVGKVDFVALDDQQANSMIVSSPATFYTFNPKRQGESYDEVMQDVVDCQIEWYTSYAPIKHAQMVGDRIGFYVNIDDDSDYDEDDDYTDLIEGNAVISALSSRGTVLWSWHIWVTESEVTAVDVGGVSFMDRNLGAFFNTIDFIDADDYTYEVDGSYGLFYQWGRKDPFLYPSNYMASGNTTAPSYNNSGSYLIFLAYPSSSLTGSVAYTTLNPRHFLAGNSDSRYDWLYQSPDNTLWGSNGVKSVYDPSPKGWRVPTSEEMAKIGDPDPDFEAQQKYYGAYLGGELFMAFGRRVYRDGSIQNYAPGDLFVPWSGYYWSSDAATDDESGARMASSLHFYLNEDGSGEVVVDRAESNYRSIGMQIRCVKDE